MKPGREPSKIDGSFKFIKKEYCGIIMGEFPEINIIPFADRVKSAARWVGHLFIEQFAHNPPTHGDHTFEAQVIPYPDHETQLGSSTQRPDGTDPFYEV